MKLTPEEKKLQPSVREWLKYIPDEARLLWFLEGTGYSKEKQIMFEKLWRIEMGLWHGDELEELAEAPVQKSSIEEMSKKEFDKYAKDEYDIELDRRKTKENMLKELEEKLAEQ